MENPTISVIVPVYNGERYLKKCLQSVICQSFQDIEIILVNDGSTDNSLDICEAFARQDNRIVIINKRNEGASFARRDGVLKARGNYIFFIDTDDYLESSTLERLIAVAYEHQADMVVGNFDRVLDNWGLLRLKMENDAMANRLVRKEELRKFFIGNNGWLMTFVWGRLIRHDCFKKAMDAHQELLFPSTRWCEDRYMNLALAPFLDSMWITNEVLYHYRFGGATSKYYPLVKGGDFHNAKYDMCRKYGFDDCLCDVFSCYTGDLYFDLCEQMFFKVGTEDEQRTFIKDQLSHSKIVAWARKSLPEKYRKEVEAEALLQHDVDKILSIARQMEKARWKKHLLEWFMKLYQRFIVSFSY